MQIRRKWRAVEGIAMETKRMVRMVRVPVDLLHQLRKQFPDLTDVSDTALVLILLRRHLATEQERGGA